jgi:sRNA-binding carbon storage regulator CsrA
MLVLGRYVGEELLLTVAGKSAVVTVRDIEFKKGAAHVRIGLQPPDGQPVQVRSLDLSESISISLFDHPVRICLTGMGYGDNGGKKKAKLGIEAPRAVQVFRREVYDRLNKGQDKDDFSEGIL